MGIPTITELKKIAQKRTRILRDSEAGLMRKTKAQERRLNSYLLNKLIPKLDIGADNRVKNTAKNLNLINNSKALRRFVKKTIDFFIQDFYISQFEKITSQTSKYFEPLGARESLVNRLDKKGEKGYNSFVESVMDSTKIESDIKRTLRKSISSQRPIGELKKLVTDTVKGKDNKLGAISSYHYQNGYNEFQEYARVLDNQFATSLDLNYGIYSGGTIKDTRKFCKDRAGKVFNRETILSWNEIPKNWQRRKADNDILVDMGGHNCRHDFDWISYELAKRINPHIIKSKFDKK